MLLIAVGLVAVASILAALGTSLPLLTAGRALQGIASGGLVQLVTITISNLFSVRKRALLGGVRVGSSCIRWTASRVSLYRVQDLAVVLLNQPPYLQDGLHPVASVGCAQTARDSSKVLDSPFNLLFTGVMLYSSSIGCSTIDCLV
jgi:hypothetical protein